MEPIRRRPARRQVHRPARRPRSRAVELLDLPGELINRVFEQLSSARDFGRAGCVCRAGRAGDSPVARVLRKRIKARGGAVSAAAEKDSTVHRLCLLEPISAAQDVPPGVMDLVSGASAAVDAEGHLCVWGKLKSPYLNIHPGPIFSYNIPTAVQTARVERVSVGSDHFLALTTTGGVLSFGWGMFGKSATAMGRTSTSPR